MKKNGTKGSCLPCFIIVLCSIVLGAISAILWRRTIVTNIRVTLPYVVFAAAILIIIICAIMAYTVRKKKICFDECKDKIPCDEPHKKPYDPCDDPHKKPHNPCDDPHKKPYDPCDDPHKEPYDPWKEPHKEPYNKPEDISYKIPYEELYKPPYNPPHKPHKDKAFGCVKKYGICAFIGTLLTIVIALLILALTPLASVTVKFIFAFLGSTSFWVMVISFGAVITCIARKKYI